MSCPAQWRQFLGEQISHLSMLMSCESNVEGMLRAITIGEKYRECTQANQEEQESEKSDLDASQAEAEIKTPLVHENNNTNQKQIAQEKEKLEKEKKAQRWREKQDKKAWDKLGKTLALSRKQLTDGLPEGSGIQELERSLASGGKIRVDLKIQQADNDNEKVESGSDSEENAGDWRSYNWQRAQATKRHNKIVIACCDFIQAKRDLKYKKKLLQYSKLVSIRQTVDSLGEIRVLSLDVSEEAIRRCWNERIDPKGISGLQNLVETLISDSKTQPSIEVQILEPRLVAVSILREAIPFVRPKMTEFQLFYKGTCVYSIAEETPDDNRASPFISYHFLFSRTNELVLKLSDDFLLINLVTKKLKLRMSELHPPEEEPSEIEELCEELQRYEQEYFYHDYVEADPKAYGYEEGEFDSGLKPLSI